MTINISFKSVFDIFESKIFFLILLFKGQDQDLEPCKCSNILNENGVGACLKRDANFNGKFSCFVAKPSACPDVIDSDSNNGRQLSAMACEDKNEGKILK